VTTRFYAISEITARVRHDLKDGLGKRF